MIKSGPLAQPSYAEAILPSAVICAAMMASATVTARFGGPSPLELFPEYVGAAAICAISSILVFIFLRVGVLAKTKPDRPLAIVVAELRPKFPLLLLPVLVTPAFLAAFTAAKTAIPTLVGFRYDHLLANLDSAIFGTDPWRLTHALIGPEGTRIIQFAYVAVWITALAFSQAMLPLFASRKLVAQFFTSRLLTWFVGGFVFAYLFPAAGPIFVDIADPTLLGRFAPLKMHIATLLPAGAPFLHGPVYLEEGIKSGTAYSGGGISAMPSIHIAVVTTYVLASRGTKWLFPSCLFASVILVGSIHSGYHYFVDSVVAATISVMCWKTVELFYARLNDTDTGAASDRAATALVR